MQAIKLTQDQTKALDALLHFLSTDESCFVLAGHAGTGKSTLIQYLVEEFKTREQLLKVVMPKYIAKEWALTATTNKAAEALSQASGTEVTTIHSLLSIRVGSNFKTGENFVYRSTKEPKRKDLIIVVDECSYIDSKLLKLINESIDNCKVIFMGDPSQLTPVFSNEVPVFHQDYPSATLSQVMRQDAHSPIQGICAEFRKTIQEHRGFPKITLCSEIQHLSKEDFTIALTQEFSRTDWKQGDSKILAWRNKTVQQYNSTLFQHLNQRSEFKKGDYVLNNHYVSGLKADGEYQVEKCYACMDTGYIKGHNIQLTGFNQHFFMPSNLKDYDKAKKKAVKEEDTARVQEIMENWVDLRPSYACTVNKSQGSTYNKVFIDLGDLGKCKDALQLARLLYVAISRARHTVIFTGDL